MGLPNSRGVPRDPRYLGSRLKVGPLSFTGLSPSMARLIQPGSTKGPICNLARTSYRPDGVSHDPTSTTDTTYHVLVVWADPLSLAATDGVAYCFTFLEVLRCFNSLGWLPWPMYSARDYQGLPGRVSPFGNPRICLLPATRGLSQVTTSFLASRCQGIHHMPLLAWPKKSEHLLGASSRAQGLSGNIRCDVR